jgi:ParB family transcriptional regulator, chromosome partitioning protein
MSADNQGRRLGRGLKALIPGAVTDGPATESDLIRIPIRRIRPNPFQPRRTFQPDELAELEASLKSSGLLQPITVRRAGDAFELIAGERRLRAATNLDWTDIPAIVKDMDDRTALVLALVENLQRSDLNAIEEAAGYRRLIDEFGYTHQQVAEGVGKDRTTVTNLLRLLALPPEVQQMVEARRLSAGHARALLPLGEGPKVSAMAKAAVDQGLSVRELEQRVRDVTAPAAAATPKRTGTATAPASTQDPSVRGIEDQLRRYLQTDIKVTLTGKDAGSIRLDFFSGEDLDRLLDLILRENRRDF